MSLVVPAVDQKCCRSIEVGGDAPQEALAHVARQPQMTR